MSRGGYRKPKNPAPVSGPGAMSQRTDGGPADPQPMRHVPTDDYGGATEMQDVQQAAPMQGATQPIPLDAPTLNPEEPITAGAPFGPGPMPPSAPDHAPQQPDDLVALAVRTGYAAYPSPALATLIDYLEAEGR